MFVKSVNIAPGSERHKGVVRLQDQIVKMTQHALDDVCRAALAVPVDKRDWSPGGKARSTVNQMREIASTPSVMIPIFQGAHSSRHETGRIPGSPDTVEQCVEVARSEFGRMCQIISAFPDIRMDEEIQTPFEEGSLITMADALMLPYWNLAYHLGQINQIQLMLGDSEMH